MEYEFRGHQALTYPGHQHPERDGVLSAEPGEIIDFGDHASPPDDQRWYDVPSGEAYSPSPHVVAGDEDSAQENSTDPED